jgi:uncharacterized protein CbrC (UPF0167 family)
MEIPVFKYHPDPIATGSIVASRGVCPVCEQYRDYAYYGVPYGIKELEKICPWCIADGSAHQKYDVQFTDPAGVGGYKKWESVPVDVTSEVAYKTPGFAGWQQEEWFTHCGDAGAFLGPMGNGELRRAGPEAIGVIRADFAARGTKAEWDKYLATLDVKNGPTAYLFRCCHCGKLGGYSDFL